jgi:hypothetical protein
MDGPDGFFAAGGDGEELRFEVLGVKQIFEDVWSVAQAVEQLKRLTRTRRKLMAPFLEAIGGDPAGLSDEGGNAFDLADVHFGRVEMVL